MQVLLSPFSHQPTEELIELLQVALKGLAIVGQMNSTVVPSFYSRYCSVTVELCLSECRNSRYLCKTQKFCYKNSLPRKDNQDPPRAAIRRNTVSVVGIKIVF